MSDTTAPAKPAAKPRKRKPAAKPVGVRVAKPAAKRPEDHANASGAEMPQGGRGS